MEKLIGHCPICQEDTEVTHDFNGCCGEGCVHNGFVWASDEMEKPDSYYIACRDNEILDVARVK